MMKYVLADLALWFMTSTTLKMVAQSQEIHNSQNDRFLSVSYVPEHLLLYPPQSDIRMSQTKIYLHPIGVFNKVRIKVSPLLFHY